MPYPITMQQGNVRVILTQREATELKAMQEERNKAQAAFQRRSDFLFRRACQRAGIEDGLSKIGILPEGVLVPSNP